MAGLIRRIARLEERIPAKADVQAEHDYEAASKRLSWRIRLGLGAVVAHAGVPIPPHCLPMIEEALDALAGDAGAQRAKDEAILKAYDRARGLTYSGENPREALIQKLLAMAWRAQPGDSPKSMAEALAMALYGQQEMDGSQD